MNKACYDPLCTLHNKDAQIKTLKSQYDIPLPELLGQMLERIEELEQKVRELELPRPDPQ